MSQKPGKHEGSAFNKLKHFLGISTSKGGSGHPSQLRQSSVKYVFTPELVKEISKGSPANNRVKTIKDLCDVVQTHRLEQNAVEVLWQSTQDLLQPQTQPDDRHLAYRFYCCLVKGQYETLGMMRAHFFRIVKTHKLYEDLPYRLTLFSTLTNDGKDLQYFEEETGTFLLEWMKDLMTSNKISEFLQLLINIVKFNAAYLDEEIISGIVLNTCVIASKTTHEQDIELCLNVLDKVVVYSYLPSASLYHFIICVCRIVNIEKFSVVSWNLMRRLLGTHLGHSAIYTMCCILQDKANAKEPGTALLRGAAFFVGMALWGSKKVATLKHPPSAVLPSFLQALEQSKSSIVAYEIVLSVHRLVNKYGKDQQMITWDIILSIVHALLKHVETSATAKPILISNMHDLLTAIEELHKQNQFNGNSDRFFGILENCANKRPETSILVLVQHKANLIHPAKDGWVPNLCHLLEKYYKHEVRTKIRLKVLDVLSYVLSANRHLHEDELIDTVVFPQLCHVEIDQDVEVRKRAAQLLVDLSHTCLSLHCLDLLNVLHRIINRPFSSAAAGSPVLLVDSSDMPRPFDSKMEDVLVALKGLVSVFHVKLYQQPISHALKIYDMLVGHVEAHYGSEHMIRFGGCLRKEVFTLLLELRADVQYRLGLPSKTKVDSYAYSSFALCACEVDLGDQQINAELTSASGTASPSVRSSPNIHPMKSVIISYAQAFKCLRICLELEKDWNVIKLLLEELPQLLQNKTLILAAPHEDIDRFAARLCAMVSNKGLGLPERFHNIPAKFSKSDFHGYVFPVLTCLVAYHTHLDKHRQTDLVKCLEFGLVSKRARICVDALAVCCLEIQDVMMRQLPSVLLRLSQISATVAMAVPLMEFLSGIIRMPQLYANFVEEQYMSVFAIALPYTNPFKYSHYTVSLAYHVIAMWFVKCKLSFRKKFVAFIVKGLRSNVLRQFEETASQRARQNQDSADRIRTNSLNDDTAKHNRGRAFSMNDAVLRKKAAAARAKLQSQGSSLNASLDGGFESTNQDSMVFHKELMETCIDAMARYTFSTITSMPKRTPVSNFLLKEGLSQSWLLGNKIITITTSGGAKVNTRGLCENCYSLARKASVQQADTGETTQEDAAGSSRRRHKSAAVSSLSVMVPLKMSSQDDMTLRRKSQDHGSTGELVDKSEMDLSSSSLSSLAGEDANGYSVQGPRRLSQESKEEKYHIVDSVLMGLKARPSDKSIFSPRICSCWCVQWAEVHIRRPTGNMAWMMRIENEQDLTEFMDFTLSDLTSLFMANSDVENYEKLTRRKKIDSMTLGDREYETLMEQHFTPHEEQNGIEGVEEQNEDEEYALRKSSSTPDLTPTSPKGKFPTEISTAENSPSNDNSDSEKAQKPVQDTKSSVELSNKSEPKQQQPDNAEKLTKPRKESTSSSENDVVEELVSFEFERSLSMSQRRSPRRPVRRKVSLPEIKRPTMLNKSSIPDKPLMGSSQHGGYNPAFLFLQLYHSNIFDSGEIRPLALPSSSPDVMRSVKMLDFVHPSETHRVGVIYIGPGQVNDESAIFANKHGSIRYVKFLQGLGHLLRLKDCKPNEVFVGGLDNDNDSDGQFAYAWRDDFMQVIYHVATLMPNKASDPNCNDKKRHIGNDFVTIVYNESGKDYKIGTIKCQFNYVSVIIQPLDNEYNTVTVQTRDDIREIIGHADTKIISDAHLALLVRQMAVHANLASTILQRQKTNPKDPYASNWLERLRQIKRVRNKIEQNTAKDKAPDSPICEDFTDFV